MAKEIGKLTPVGVKALKEPGRYSDGANLYVVVSKTGAKTWSFIYRWRGRQREAGFGSVGALRLKEARERAQEGRALIVKGKDPLAVWQAAKRAKSVPDFEEATQVFLEKKTSEWRSDKQKRQARVMLKKHCKPIARLPVNEIDTRDVLGVLKPLWAKAPAVALRLRGYIENVISAAKAIGDIDEHKANPARWRGHLKHLLPERSKKSRHFAAMPYSRLPDFVVDLRDRRFNEEGSFHVPAYALEFTVLTAVRAGEALGCRWDEIDLPARTWTLPERRMKTGRAFEVPLSDAAVAIIAAMRAVRVEHCPFVFPGRFRSVPISSKAFERLLKLMKEPFTTHGFRSAFRDWAGNETATPRDVCEMALAHKVGDVTEQAYRRSDALAKRRKLMDAWAAYLSWPPADNVMPFKTLA
jgi:integrase